MCYTAINSIYAGVYVLVAAARCTSSIDSVADGDQVIQIQLTLHFSHIFLSQLRRKNIQMNS